MTIAITEAIKALAEAEQCIGLHRRREEVLIRLNNAREWIDAAEKRLT